MEQLSKAMENRYILKFDKTTSLYEQEEKLSNPADDSAFIKINISGGGKEFKDLKQKRAITETEIFGKEFLIEDSLERHDWKLGSETKKIGNYTCYKATYIIKPKPQQDDNNSGKTVMFDALNDKETVVTAWYTPEIPVSNGPGSYWGLPGLILEVNDGYTTLLCSKLTLNPKEKFTIKPPVKGKRVTQAEFDRIMEEKAKEMEEMDSGRGSGNQTVIKIGG
jgi:GLPGLI family protein